MSRARGDATPRSAPLDARRTAGGDAPHRAASGWGHLLRRLPGRAGLPHADGHGTADLGRRARRRRKELGVDGAQCGWITSTTRSAPDSALLAAMAARTGRVELGTGVIDMQCEGPRYMGGKDRDVDLTTGGWREPRVRPVHGGPRTPGSSPGRRERGRPARHGTRPGTPRVPVSTSVPPVASARPPVQPRRVDDQVDQLGGAVRPHLHGRAGRYGRALGPPPCGPRSRHVARTVLNHLGGERNARLLRSFIRHVAPAIG
jgi:hypothetical protein